METLRNCQKINYPASLSFYRMSASPYVTIEYAAVPLPCPPVKILRNMNSLFFDSSLLIVRAGYTSERKYFQRLHGLQTGHWRQSIIIINIPVKSQPVAHVVHVYIHMYVFTRGEFGSCPISGIILPTGIK